MGKAANREKKTGRFETWKVAGARQAKERFTAGGRSGGPILSVGTVGAAPEGVEAASRKSGVFGDKGRGTDEEGGSPVGNGVG